MAPPTNDNYFVTWVNTLVWLSRRLISDYVILVPVFYWVDEEAQAWDMEPQLLIIQLQQG